MHFLWYLEELGLFWREQLTVVLLVESGFTTQNINLFGTPYEIQSCLTYISHRLWEMLYSSWESIHKGYIIEEREKVTVRYTSRVSTLHLIPLHPPIAHPITRFHLGLYYAIFVYLTVYHPIIPFKICYLMALSLQGSSSGFTNAPVYLSPMIWSKNRGLWQVGYLYPSSLFG